MVFCQRDILFIYIVHVHNVGPIFDMLRQIKNSKNKTLRNGNLRNKKFIF